MTDNFQVGVDIYIKKSICDENPDIINACEKPVQIHTINNIEYVYISQNADTPLKDLPSVTDENGDIIYSLKIPLGDNNKDDIINLNFRLLRNFSSSSNA